MTAKGMVFTTWHRTGITLLLAGITWNTVAHANTDIESLIAASRAQDSETVQALLLDGVNVNGQQADGATALHWAAYRDDLNLASLLIKAGADLNKANELGATPLFLAADNGSADMVKLLLESGANPNVPLQGGESPLMTAARTGNADAVQNLIEHGADVNLTEDRRAGIGRQAGPRPAQVEPQRHLGGACGHVPQGDVDQRLGTPPRIVATAQQAPRHRLPLQGGGRQDLRRDQRQAIGQPAVGRGRRFARRPFGHVGGVGSPAFDTVARGQA